MFMHHPFHRASRFRRSVSGQAVVAASRSWVETHCHASSQEYAPPYPLPQKNHQNPEGKYRDIADDATLGVRGQLRSAGSTPLGWPQIHLEN